MAVKRVIDRKGKDEDSSVDGEGEEGEEVSYPTTPFLSGLPLSTFQIVMAWRVEAIVLVS